MFKNLVIGAALSLSTFAMAAPPAHAGFGRGAAPHEARADARDVSEGRQLLRELDRVTARRDFRAVRTLDARIEGFIEAELAESRREAKGERDRGERREERASTQQLKRLLGALHRVDGRFHPYAMAEKRRILVEAVNLAERDLRDARQDRFSRR